MSYYKDVYSKRLNRYGSTYQTRVQGEREHEFESYLAKSVYKVNFTYNAATVPATLEPYKQDESQTINYLLTRVDMNIPAGTVLAIADKDNINRQWMIWWLEDYKASGYNRYVVLKMTHNISWTVDSTTYSSYVYFSGPGSSVIRDTIETMPKEAIWLENNNLYTMIMPTSQYMNRNVYIEITTDNLTDAFYVTDLDRHSISGVSYVSLDPRYKKDTTAAPQQTADDDSQDFYWLNGGN